MKKFSRYLRNPPSRKKRRARSVRRGNPAPYALTAINPARKKSRRKNSARTHRRKSRRNPLELQHVLVEKRNPHRRKIRHKNRKKNPFTMSHRKRRSKSRRNPMHRTRRRHHSRKRNPARRHRSLMRRMRNPAILSDLTAKDTIKAGVGFLAGVGGTNMIMNWLISGGTNGAPVVQLPGITYSTAAAPLTQVQFAAQNKMALGVYRALVPAVLGYLSRNWDGTISKSLYASAIFNAGAAALSGTDIGAKAGLGTMIPGVPAILSGPASAPLLAGGMGRAFNPRLGTRGTAAFLPRGRGMNASVTAGWHQRTVNGVADPFSAS